MVHAVLAQAGVAVPWLSIPDHMLLNAGGPATLCPGPNGCRCLLAVQINWRLSTEMTDSSASDIPGSKQPVCSGFDLLVLTYCLTYWDKSIYNHIYIIPP